MTFPIQSSWHPEFGSWMVEATPGVPYGGDIGELGKVEQNMAMRRWRITAAAPSGVTPFSLPCFPYLGVSTFSTSPASPLGGPFSKSSFLSDSVISPHPRFGALSANIRRRRGAKVNIRVPLFMDSDTLKGLHVEDIADPRLDEKGMKEATSWPSIIPPVTEATEFFRAATLWKAQHRLSGVDCPEESAHPADGSLDSNGFSYLKGATKTPPSTPKMFDVTLSPKPSFSRHSGKAFLSSLPTDLSLEGGREDNKSAGAASNSTSVPKQHQQQPVRPPFPSVLMDGMPFGMGCCCLQVTFQARDLKESRNLYDQLAPWTPLLLALTANTPIFRGHLVDTDTRWEVIGASVDCRTPLERGEEEEVGWQKARELSCGAVGAGGRARLSKSRYSTIDAYISDSPRLVEEYHNDLPINFDQSAMERLSAVPGIDYRLARHVAHLFVRDPLVMFQGRISELDDFASGEHFESIQSTNWRSMRWKPPPVDNPNIGWRVELRSMEVQCTDFENAAFTVFSVLLSRVILFFDLNFYMPLSLVDENFRRANAVGSSVSQVFWFPKQCILPSHASECDGSSSPHGSGDWGGLAAEASREPGGVASAASTPSQLSLAQILLGDVSGVYPGIIPIIFAYLEIIGCDPLTLEVISTYLKFIKNRATGEALTGASWQRRFVRSHPLYKNDSVVPPGTVTDLLQAVKGLGVGTDGAASLALLTGPLDSPPIPFSPASLPPPHPSSAHHIDSPAFPPPEESPSVRLRGSSFFREITGSKSRRKALREFLTRRLEKEDGLSPLDALQEDDAV